MTRMLRAFIARRQGKANDEVFIRAVDRRKFAELRLWLHEHQS